MTPQCTVTVAYLLDDPHCTVTVACLLGDPHCYLLVEPSVFSWATPRQQHDSLSLAEELTEGVAGKAVAEEVSEGGAVGVEGRVGSGSIRNASADTEAVSVAVARYHHGEGTLHMRTGTVHVSA